MLQGQSEEALAVAEETVQLRGRWAVPLCGLGMAHAVAGREREARLVLREMEDVREGRASASNVALLAAALGDREATLSWLAKAVEQREPAPAQILNHPVFDPVRADPRFVALLRTMNLA